MFGSDKSDRKPASLLRTGTETSSLAVVVMWLAQTYLTGVPPEVQVAGAGLAVGLISTLLSLFRNRGIGGALTGANKD